MQHYVVPWDEALISATEARLQQIHQVADEFLKTFHSGEGSVDPCGSFLLRSTTFTSPMYSVASATDRGVGADICITLPASFCSLADVQEGRYLAKRQEFLHQLLQFIRKRLVERKSDDGARVVASSVNFVHGTGKQIVRVVFFGGKGSQQRELFHIDVLCRPETVGARVASEKGMQKHPLYSSLVLEDFLLLDHLKRFHQACLSSHNVSRAIVFLRAWAAHTGLVGSSCPESLTPFSLTAMVVRLMEEGVVNTSLSEENIVRATWVRIAQGGFMNGHGEPFMTFNEEKLNVLFRMSAPYLSLVRRTAEEALKFKQPIDAFASHHIPLEMTFDVALTVRGLPETVEGDAFKSNASKSSQYLGSEIMQQIVEQALTQRKFKSTLCWIDGKGRGTVLIKLTSDAEARKKLTVGPAIEDASGVATFDTFWGSDITSTRQFADGSIHKCVSWTVVGPHETSSATSHVLARIVHTALQKHIASTATTSPLLGSLEEFVYEASGSEFVDVVTLVEPQIKQAMKKIHDMFENLHVASLPCRISSFDVISPVTRGCEPFAVRPHIALSRSTDALQYPSQSPSIEPINCVLSIDDKHKIPDTIEAIEMMKGAICAQLSKVLRTSFPDFLVMCTSHSVDIAVSGFLFRVYVAHYREVSLLRALQKDAEAAFLERKLFWTTRHTKFVETISNGHTSFGPSVRLARRWVSAMCLGEYIVPEVIELLVADAYLRDHPPCSGPAGFVRFLSLIASHDWNTPLVLPTTTIIQSSLQTRPTESAMWILTPYAADGSPFTLQTPRHMILHRLIGVSRSALHTITTRLLSGDGSLEKILESSLFWIDDSDFDAVIPFASSVLTCPDRKATLSDKCMQELPVHRFWRLDELSSEESKKYITQLVEMEPMSQCVKGIKGRLRERSMTFVDNIGPSKLACVLLAPNPTSSQVSQLKMDVLALARGFVATPERQPPIATSSKRKNEGKQKKRQREQATA